MADFTPIGALIKPQQPMSLGDVVNIAQGAQAYQQAQKINPLQLQQEQYKAQQAQLGQQDTQALNQFMSDPTNWQDENGKIDINKINKTVPKIAPYLGAQFISTMSTLSKNETDALDASQNLETKQRGIIAGALGATGRQNVTDPNVYKSELDNLIQLYPNNKDIQKLVQSTKNIIDTLPQGSSLPNFAIKFGQSLLGASEQQTQLAPKVEMVNRGGSLQPVISQPSVGANAPSITPTSGAMSTTLAPQTVKDEAGNLFQVGGGNAGIAPISTVPQVPSVGGVQPQGQTQPGIAPSGFVNKLQAGTMSGGVVTGAEGYGNFFKQAQNADQVINLASNIKQFAKQAPTGFGSEYKSIGSGLLGLIGITAGQDARTNYDLLNKNSSMLVNSLGGDSDLARKLIESANPNGNMTNQAIDEAANQVIGQQKYLKQRFKYFQNSLQQHSNDPFAGGQALINFSENVDPKVMQFEELSDKQKVNFLNSMPDAERKAFRGKIEKYEAFTKGQ